MRFLLAVSDRIDAILHAVAMFFAWSFILCITAICFDVVSRKLGFQIPEFGSTRLQELEWHLHAVLFCTWLGYAYVRDAHVRIDVATINMSERRKAWLELAGCAIFAAPYLYVALPYAHDFFVVSFLQNESSDAPNGLAYRWIIKGFLYLSFWGVLLAVVSVALRRIVFLFGDRDTAAGALAPRRPGEA
jgi:TRAP-type mannitol/chloroaromatic compound transport system permease small subunit